MNHAREISSLASSSKRIGIFLHKNPDGDAIGSAVALKLALKKKTVSIICHEKIAEVFTSVTGPIKTSSHIGNPDLVIVVDVAELHRVSAEKELVAASNQGVKIVVIDHHRQGNLHKLADIYFKDNESAATTELVWQILREMRVLITPRIANALLLGLFTDTGGFKNANTSFSTLELAGRLITHGAQLKKISSSLSQKRTIPQMKLWGHALSQLQVSSSGIVASRISKEAIELCGATVTDIAGLANVLALTENTKAALVLYETADKWKGTLRSKNRSVDLGRLAALLGGKGTAKAGGFTATSNDFSGTISAEALSSIPELDKDS